MGMYKSEVDAFYKQLETYDEVLMDRKYDHIGISKELSRMHFYKRQRNRIDYNEIKNLFIRSIEPLGKNTRDYYKGVINKIKVQRTSELYNGDALIVNTGKNKTIFVTDKKFLDIDLIAFSHEFGHSPTIDYTANKDYFEYGEALSIFFEYLACKTIEERDAFELFLNERLKVSKEECSYYLKMRKEFKGNNSYKDQFIECHGKEVFRYLISLDYVLQLIDRFKKDRVEVNKSIDSIITENNNFKKLEKSLDIDTNDCRTLLKVSKRYI